MNTIPAEDEDKDTRGYGIKEVVVDAVTAALSPVWAQRAAGVGIPFVPHVWMSFGEKTR